MSVYPLEDRMKAVQLYLKYGRKSAPVVRELGYPGRKTLRRWVAAYEATGSVGRRPYRGRPPKYTSEQREAAVRHYLEHGQNMSGTIRALGYPCRALLSRWLDEAIEERRRVRTGTTRKARAELTPQQKQEAVLDLCSRDGRAQDVANKHGVTRAVLYKWKKQLLGSGYDMSPPKKPPAGSRDEKEQLEALKSQLELLEQQAEDLRKEIRRLQLERDVLEATAEILKQGEGADPTTLRNREKAVVIGALREKHRLKDLLQSLSLSKSSYFYQRAALAVPDKLADVRERVRRVFTQAERRYGYRRIHAALRRDGVVISEKVVRRLMREEGLEAVRPKRRKYVSYRGEISPAVSNLIKRDFRADAPNTKWLTDTTEFAIPAGKVYLSPIIDCFDGMVVSWSIGTSPNADLVNSMLDQAISTLGPGEHPTIHTDRGGHYRWPGWIERMEAAGLTRSMSKKACTADNAACEGFFGRIKNEMFYGRSWQGVSIPEFVEILDTYLRWYNERRIKMSLGAMSPAEYREGLNCA